MKKTIFVLTFLFLTVLFGFGFSAHCFAQEQGTEGESTTTTEQDSTTEQGKESPDEEKQLNDGNKQDQQQHSNHLVNETSLYLLMHAHNPVDWYPWGPEALEKARTENKVIFLSIGYSSCHWCHVMEEESFKDDAIAAFLNEHFVCIKVDREERPDLDTIYMQSLTSYNQVVMPGRRISGGWPLSMFLTPDAKPFFGATYIPPHDGDRGVQAGFLSVIRNVNRVWKAEPDQITKSAEQITHHTVRNLNGKSPGDGVELDRSWVDGAISDMQQQFDPVHGGFEYSDQNSEMPKFPREPRLDFLINQLETRKDGPLKEQVRSMLKLTLDKMMLGGMRDHLGGGFHRYSVDRFWRIPHFEKMLYDNGQLASIYARASKLFDDQEYRNVTRELVDFVIREMTAPEGGFYSALDADSDGEEGAFYRWEKSEIEELLDEKQFDLAAKVYGFNGKPNFDEKYFALYLTLPPDRLAPQLQVELKSFQEQMNSINLVLTEARDKRNRPLTDDKILTAWNGLMIRGMADAGRILEESKYVDAAAKAADFIWDSMRTEDNRLYRTHAKGQAKLNAYVDDYAFLIEGLLALHEATGDTKWLDRAEILQNKQDELFWSEQDGGYFFTSIDHEQLMVRTRKIVDQEVPSANSVSVTNLLKLAELKSNPAFRLKAAETAESITGLLRSYPAAAPRMLMSIDLLLEKK